MAVALDTTLFSSLSGDNVGTFALVKHPMPAVVVLAAAPMVPALLVRNRFPTAVALGLAGYAALLTVTLGSRPLVVLLVSLYTAASLTSQVRWMPCFAANLAAHALTVAYETDPPSKLSTVVAVAVVFLLFDVAALSFGLRTARARRREADLLAHRAALAAEAVAAERLRIARELHDIVANAVTIIVLQAAAAQSRVRQDPVQAEQALATIERTADEAMVELRRLLVVLRAVSESSEPGGVLPGLAGVDVLVQQAEAAGVDLTLSISDDLGPLDPSIDLTVYRIIQESLTNAARYAGRGCKATVTVTEQAGSMVVEVVDDGAGVTTSRGASLSTGSGLVGLRERVSLLGGRLCNSAGPDGGWTVSALLPLRDLDASGER